MTIATGTDRHKLLEVNEDGSGICQKCGPVRLSWYAARERWLCSVARAAKRGPRNRPAGRTGVRERLGVTPAEVAALIEAQHGECAICGEGIDMSSHLDHCHRTMRVRGVLCRGCNLGLGHFADDPARLEAAIRYLNN